MGLCRFLKGCQVVPDTGYQVLVASSGTALVPGTARYRTSQIRTVPSVLLEASQLPLGANVKAGTTST